MATQTIIYNNLPLRIITAFVATFFIIFHERWSDFFVAFTYTSFYISFASSFAIALLLIYIIHRSSSWLDGYFSWRKQPFERAAFQLLLGLFLPIAAQLVVLSFLLALYGQTLNSTGFFEREFIIVLLFIVVVNLYYVLHYFIVSEAIVPEPDKLVVEHNFLMVTLDPEKEIIYFHKQGNLVKAICSTGEEYTLKDSLRSLQERYEQKKFCRINKSVIVNTTMLRGYQAILKKRVGLVVFKPEVLAHVEHRQTNLFMVTTANIGPLKKLL